MGKQASTQLAALQSSDQLVETVQSALRPLVEALPAWAIFALVGGALLFFGRKLYWLLLASVGFLLGFGLVSEFLVTSTPSAAWIAGAIGGLLGVLAAFLIQGVLLAAVGALLGALAALVIASMFQVGSTTFLILAAILGAIAGALVMRKLFFATLVVVTAALGAGMVLEVVVGLALTYLLDPPVWLVGLNEPSLGRTISFAVLMLVGVLVQARGLRRSNESGRQRKRTRSLEREIKRLEKDRRRRVGR